MTEKAYEDVSALVVIGADATYTKIISMKDLNARSGRKKSRQEKI